MFANAFLSVQNRLVDYSASCTWSVRSVSSHTQLTQGMLTYARSVDENLCLCQPDRVNAWASVRDKRRTCVVCVRERVCVWVGGWLKKQNETWFGHQSHLQIMDRIQDDEEITSMLSPIFHIIFRCWILWDAFRKVSQFLVMDTINMFGVKRKIIQGEFSKHSQNCEIRGLCKPQSPSKLFQSLDNGIFTCSLYINSLYINYLHINKHFTFLLWVSLIVMDNIAQTVCMTSYSLPKRKKIF